MSNVVVSMEVQLIRYAPGDEQWPIGSCVGRLVHSGAGIEPFEMEGWLECNGRLLYVRQYPLLADVLQGQFGGWKHPSERIFKRFKRSPRWSSIPGYRQRWFAKGTFQLPDLRGRTMLGIDWGRA